MELEDNEGMNWSRMKSIRGFLVYVARTQRGVNPYFKGTNLTLDIWRPYRDEEGWRLLGKELNMAEHDGKWDEMNKVNKPKLVMGGLRLIGDLLKLGRLTKDKVTQQRKFIL